ncbi:hypothetical protein NSK_006178 [Nannochloropsis salina CCMP1776]|uniref:Uncharacterized protein n=1 Tax=Nannochloropsis salina CCMP1776 TaxID=1027361 RepID=A0A4D9D1K8_9STRA|nr:hypothetical protein NSK_006178 [Nannochloropsis salina CCMP1776]|eukprot:TFJ82499.1 hypothetical protein NSK_006178 [Nannochloropsis salina CCMP1776]
MQPVHKYGVSTQPLEMHRSLFGKVVNSQPFLFLPMSDGGMEAVEAVMDVDVGKDCTVAMVADTVEAQTTGAMNARNPTQKNIPTLAC